MLVFSLLISPLAPLFAAADAAPSSEDASPSTVDPVASEQGTRPSPLPTGTVPDQYSPTRDVETGVGVADHAPISDVVSEKQQEPKGSFYPSTHSSTGGDTHSAQLDKATVRSYLRAEVDESSGTFRYSVPIELPPGRNGLTPQLSLLYRSDTYKSNGPLGYGWALSIPYIDRTHRSGEALLIWNDSFTSSMDGELVLVSTSSTSKTYAPKSQIESFRQYIWDTQSGGWLVKEKGGTRYVFGASSASRLEDPRAAGMPSRWMLDNVRDTNDNFIQYNYTKDSEQIYPETIRYTGNGSTDGVSIVTFIREIRSDASTSSAHGFPIRNNYRIKEIRTEHAGTLTKTYTLNYTVGSNDASSLLEHITVSGRAADGVEYTYPPTTFSYQAASPTWTLTSWSVPELLIDGSVDQGTRLVDYNGDGLLDLVRSYENANSVVTASSSYRNTGAGWVADTRTVPEPFTHAGLETGTRLIDVDGDGLVDLLRSQWRPWSPPDYDRGYRNTGDGWTFATTGVFGFPHIASDDEDYGFRFGDLNGDGLVDAVQGTWSTSARYSWVNLGVPWQPNIWDVSDTLWAAPDKFLDSYPETFPMLGDSGQRLIDINGDDLVDIINTHVYLNTGRGFQIDTFWSPPATISPSSDNGVRYADVDGDGLTDILQAKEGSAYKVYLNTGSRWVYKPAWVLPVPLSVSAGGLYVDSGTFIEDVDGDGLTDFLRSYKDGANEFRQYWRHDGVKANLLKAISTPQGAVTTVEYTQTPKVSETDGTLKNPELPLPRDVVTSVTQTDGRGASITTQYSYGGGTVFFGSPRDRKFAGFATTTIIDSAGNVTKTYYHQGNASESLLGEYQDHASKTGRPYRIERYDASGNLYELSINKWDSHPIGAAASFVKLSRKTTLSYDGNADHKDMAVEYAYDDATGNLTQKAEYGEVTAATDGSFTDIGSDKRTTDITYAASSTGYLYALKQETVKNQAGTTLADTKYTYDNLVFGSVAKGNPTKIEQWIGGTTWIDTEKSYNSYGLVTQERDPREKITTYTYDPYDLYPATTTNPAGRTTYREYDYSSGKVTKEKNPNGHWYETVYDGLDRPVLEKQPDATTPATLVTKTAYEYTNTKSETKAKRTDYFDTSNAVDSYQYFDGFGRLIQTRVEAEDPNTFSVSDRQYNERGELKKESLPYLSTGAASTTPTAATTLYTVYTYDALGRPKTVVTAVGTTTYAYDQWGTVVTDPAGNAKGLYKDAYDRLTKVEEHNGASTYATTYEYDALDSLTKLTDALGNIRNFTYDGLKRRTKAEDLHAPGDSTFGTYLYAYDAAGNVASTTNPRGQTVNYTYDDVNRPLTEDYLGQAGTEVTYAYDTCTNGKGKLCTATSSGAVASYAYDPLGRTASEAKKIGGTTYTTSYVYDRLGNQTLLTYPDSAQVRYTYNSAGQIERVEHKESGGSFADVVEDIDYGPHGKVTYKKFPNGTESTYTYDAYKLYRLTNTRTDFVGGQGGMLEDIFFGGVQLLKDGFRALMEAVTTPFAEAFATSSPEAVPADTPEEDAPPADTSTTTTEEAALPIVESPVVPTVADAAASLTAQPSGPVKAATSTEPAPPHEESELRLPAPVEELLAATSTPYRATGLVESVHDARAWRSYHKERVAYLEARPDLPKQALQAARHAENRYERFLLSKGYIKAPKEDITPARRVQSALEVQAKRVLSWLLPSAAYAYVFGTEDFESCGSLPCSFDTNDAWGSVTASLDHTSQVTGEDSLKEVVAGEGGGALKKSGLSTNELWVKFKVFVPQNLAFGPSGYFSILMLQDGSANDTVWLNVEDWGTARLSLGGDTLGWMDTGLDLVKGQVNTIQMRVKIGASNGDVDIWLNTDTEGAPSYNGSGTLNTGTDSIDKVLAGLVYAPESGISTTYYDDITVDAAFIGAGGGTPALSYQDISYTYDAVGNITKIVDASGTLAAGTTTYAYDPLYRLTGATTTQAAGGANWAETYAYNPLGNITAKSDIGSYTYAGTGYANPHAVTAVAGTTWEYDESGNVTNDGTWSYTYDYLNRLTEAAQGTATQTAATIVYDDATSWNNWSWDTTVNFNNTSPVYQGSKSIRAQYTAAWGGLYLQKDTALNVSARETLNFAVRSATGGIDLELDLYNDSDAFLGYVMVNDYIPGGTIAANTWYDIAIPIEDIDTTGSTIGGIVLMSDTGATVYVDHIRFEGQTAGAAATSTRYLYDHTGARTAYFDGTATTTYANMYYEKNGATSTKHVFSPAGELLASIEGTGGSAQVKTVHTDHLGGTNVVTNRGGQIEQTLAYYPYGATRLDQKSGTFSERNKFTGHELDDTTGLYYMQARYQSPATGRFVSQDPAFWALPGKLLTNPQKQNSYTYADNNPIINKDANGEFAILAVGALAPGITAGMATWALAATAVVMSSGYIIADFVDSGILHTGTLADGGPREQFVFPHDPNEFRPPRNGSPNWQKWLYRALTLGALGNEAYNYYKKFIDDVEGDFSGLRAIDQSRATTYIGDLGRSGCLSCATRANSTAPAGQSLSPRSSERNAMFPVSGNRSVQGGNITLTPTQQQKVRDRNPSLARSLGL